MSSWPCPERLCDGVVTDARDDDWMIYTCDGCGTEWAKHISKVDSGVRRQTKLEQAGLPDAFRGLKFDETEENKSALYILRAWLADCAKGDPLPAPALHGAQGRGKTHLLTAICTRLITEQDTSVMFTSVRGLLRDLQRFDDEVKRGQVWERAITCPFLALDDLGAQQITGWRDEQLAELVDERYAKELPIVLATNFPPKTWGEVVDVRTASRLAGMTFPVELKGPDRRQVQIEMPKEN
jgi:chromosomal replication initiation ATPase DnaA